MPTTDCLDQRGPIDPVEITAGVQARPELDNPNHTGCEAAVGRIAQHVRRRLGAVRYEKTHDADVPKLDRCVERLDVCVQRALPSRDERRTVARHLYQCSQLCGKLLQW